MQCGAGIQWVKTVASMAGQVITSLGFLLNLLKDYYYCYYVVTFLWKGGLNSNSSGVYAARNSVHKAV
jgi:hypothetical protein